MWATLIIAAGVLVAVVLGAGYLYFSGHRSRQQQAADQQASGKGRKQQVVHGATRAQGRGDL